MADKDHSSAMNNAQASVRMEGFEATPEMRERCQCVLNGKITTTDALMQLLSERERQNLREALASTRMEGFAVTKQTEEDCIRLLAKEISTADLVKEIISRSRDLESDAYMNQHGGTL